MTSKELREILTGPAWLHCMSEIVHQHRDDVESMEDDYLIDESERVEVTCPPTNPDFNNRDWRSYRRLIRQEMHSRGLS